MDPKWNLLSALWGHRTKLLVLVLIASLMVPQPVGAIRHRLGRHRGSDQQHRNRDIQYDWPGATTDQRSIGTLNGLMSSLQAFFINIVYPSPR